MEVLPLLSHLTIGTRTLLSGLNSATTSLMSHTSHSDNRVAAADTLRVRGAPRLSGPLPYPPER